MQALLPCNVAVIAIAALFYLWRDLYVPRRRGNEQAREQVSNDHPRTGRVEAVAVRNPRSSEARDDFDEPDQAAFVLYREVECRACKGKHSFGCASTTKRQAGNTFEFTCPVVQKSAWIWWLGKPEPVEELPVDAVLLTWVAG